MSKVNFKLRVMCFSFTLLKMFFTINYNKQTKITRILKYSFYIFYYQKLSAKKKIVHLQKVIFII